MTIRRSEDSERGTAGAPLTAQRSEDSERGTAGAPLTAQRSEDSERGTAGAPLTAQRSENSERGTAGAPLRKVLGAINTGANAVLIGLIRVYQYAISPMLGQRCKYYPSCSNYAVGALREHGVLKGFGLATWRILRCNPFSNGGYDPVPSRRHDCRHDHTHENVSARV